MNDQARTLREIAAQQPVADTRPRVRKSGACRSIAVTGGKGGIGKSNVAICMALALSRLKQRVLLLDADLGLANIHILLGLAPRFNLAHLLRNECSMQDILYQGPGGITIIPGASGLEDMANLSSERLAAVLRALGEVENHYDYLIIDVGAGIAQNTVTLGAFADIALLILTPEPTSLADVYATLKAIHAKGGRRVPVLVNMANSEAEGQEIFGKLSELADRFLQVKLDCAGILPLDADIPRLVRQQKNIMLEKPESGFTRRILNCARLLCGLPYVRTAEGFFARLFAKRH